ncbi:MAG: hypothetical protein DSY55_06535 [Clostridia bacterium]|nr:MAG: hypothetical protein DSY55_06535 [Clostridia bacterium]
MPHTDLLQPPIVITHPDQLAALIESLEQAGRFALDTESNSMHAYHYQICLIQISTDRQDYIIDPLALSDLTPLGGLVAREDIEITMHAAENDVLLLNKDFGWIFGNLFDTLWGARILGWQRPGLASIMQEQFGVTLDKRMQRTDWGKRPLSAEQLAYARMDTHFLLSLRDRIEQALREVGCWGEAQDVFAALRSIRWREKAAATIWRLSGVRELTPDQLAVLNVLFDWREKRASQRNVPSYRIMRNEILLALARQQPTTEQRLMRTPGISQRFPSHLARKLASLIRSARHAPPPPPPERHYNGHRMDEVETARYEALRRWRLHKAQQRGVEVDVVMTNALLETLARAHPASLQELAALNLLGSWRLQAYGQEVLDVMQSVSAAA